MHNSLHRLFHVPHERPNADVGVTFVEFFHQGEDWLYFVIFNNGNDGGVHFGPCVSASVRVAVLAATSLHVFPKSEPAGSAGVKYIFHTFRICLIECYKYRFHISCFSVSFLNYFDKCFYTLTF